MTCSAVCGCSMHRNEALYFERMVLSWTRAKVVPRGKKFNFVSFHSVHVHRRILHVEKIYNFLFEVA